MTPRSFGTMPDGTEVEAVDDCQWRATVDGHHLWCRDPGRPALGCRLPLVLGFDTIEAYLRNPTYFGAVAGRFANRIARRPIHARRRDLISWPRTSAPNHLHGGFDGFGTRVWTSLRSDAVQRDAGDRRCGWRERLSGPRRGRTDLFDRGAGDACVRSIRATTDKPTIVNLAQHSYFNLDGAGTIRDHVLTVPAETYLPVDAGKSRPASLLPVAGTAVRFPYEPQARSARVSSNVDIYDHNFVRRRRTKTETPHPHGFARLDEERRRARDALDGARRAVLWRPYDRLRAMPASMAKSMAPMPAFAWSRSSFPDAPNHPEFPSAVLRPGEDLSAGNVVRIRPALIEDKDRYEASADYRLRPGPLIGRRSMTICWLPCRGLPLALMRRPSVALCRNNPLPFRDIAQHSSDSNECRADR